MLQALQISDQTRMGELFVVSMICRVICVGAFGACAALHEINFTLEWNSFSTNQMEAEFHKSLLISVRVGRMHR